MAFADLVDAAQDNAQPDNTPVEKPAAEVAPANNPAEPEQAAEAPEETQDAAPEAAEGSKGDAVDAAPATDTDADADKDDDAPTLDDLIDALAALDTSLQAGQPIDPTLLDKLNTAAQALSALMGLTTPINGAVTPTADTGTTTPIDPASLLGQLTQKISDLAASVKATSPDLAGKLDALAQKLASGEVSADTLAKLGFTAELKAADPAINQALTALVNSKTAAPKEAPPTIATPELKIPDATLLTPKVAPAPMASAALPPPPTVATPSDDDDASASATQDKAKEQVRSTTEAMAKMTADTGKDAKPAPSDTLNGAAAAAAAARTELPPAAARVIQAAYQGPPSPINLPHMAFEIARQVHAGSNKFQIRLDPADLGRVDVSLDIDKNGTVNARLVVEKMETLDLMQRDQRSLEKALQQAGLDSSKTNLEFSLKQNSSGRQDGGKDSSLPFGNSSGSDGDGAIEAVPTSIYRGSTSPSGVNIFV